MSDSSLSVGIDLGTTNSTAAWTSVENNAAEVQIIDVPQIAKPGTTVDQQQLPSALYIPFAGEHQPEELSLPWDNSAEWIVGRYAKERASTAPDRVILSAKSWLCNPNVDRKEAILPWQSEIAEPKMSPFTASKRLLEHLRAAVDYRLQQSRASLESCEVTVTVPASFDEVARNLTAEAASMAGLPQTTLLEEPLAAMYAWIAAAGESWREQIAPGDIILVCDLGGGTADFSLISVSDRDGTLALDRLSVGDHLLLGGDNMDLALAYQLKAKLEAEGKSLDTWQFQALIHEGRRVKERMLSGDDQSLPVTLAGRGSSLFASTLQVEARREELLSLILDGFFPEISFDELPDSEAESGIQEFGLPFETEPAVTKHLAAFLRQSAEQAAKMKDLPENTASAAAQGALFPSAVLFNGGVCKAALVRSRVLSQLAAWRAAGGFEGELRELTGNDYDTAVALGAAHYGRIRHSGKGLRIRAGTSRSYYLGLQSSAPAVPGFRPPVKGVCVVPQGMEEGTEVSLTEQTFSLLTGKEVEFRFFSSHQRPDDSPGKLVADAESTLDETSRLRVTLPKGEAQKAETVPVHLHSYVTEVGTLELWMQASSGEQRWKLEFDVRAEKKTPGIRQPMTSNSAS